MIKIEQRQQIAKSILNFEARRDKKGRLRVFRLPPGDGGGTFEVAGINDRFHPEEVHHLVSLIKAGRFEEAENQAIEFIATFTDVVSTWSNAVVIESYLRDCAFNRGPRGAARILQRALQLEDDGFVGPLTRAALAQQESNALALLQAMRVARESYERDVAKRDESSIFWKGLVNRWNKALIFAQSFIALAPAVSVEGALATVHAAGAVVPEPMREVTGVPPTPPSASPVVPLVPAPTAVPLSPEPILPAMVDIPVIIPALRNGNRGALVLAWQSFLGGQGFDPGEPDGIFGDKTEAATKAFQAHHNLEADGRAGRRTLAKAMELGFELIEEPAADRSGSNFPPRPNFAPLAGLRARQSVFGAFEFVPHPVPGNRENIKIIGNWEEQNIIKVDLPQLRKALGANAPTGMRFHRFAAEQLARVWEDWEKEGLLTRIRSNEGAFVPRFIRNSRTVLSNHAFGSAFDINAATNGLGVRPALVGQPGSVRELVAIANKWGFYWGGHFSSRLDGMHFEIAFIR